MNAFPASPPALPPSHDLSPQQLVASSSGWLAVSLNLGCQGVGYIYQRRWRAFWIGGVTGFATALLLGMGAIVLNPSLRTAVREQGLEENLEVLVETFISGASVGLLLVGSASAVEAGVATRRARRRRDR